MAMFLVGRGGLTMTHSKSISRHTNPDVPSSPSENCFLEPVNTMHWGNQDVIRFVFHYSLRIWLDVNVQLCLVCLVLFLSVISCWLLTKCLSSVEMGCIRLLVWWFWPKLNGENKIHICIDHRWQGYMIYIYLRVPAGQNLLRQGLLRCQFW